MSTAYTIRRAMMADFETLVEFTATEAYEAEGVRRDPEGVRRGVGGGFQDPPVATYWVAEASGGRIVASTSIVTEWSDFNGGFYWWIQSLFIVPEHRGRGLVEQLLDHLQAEARRSGALELRLYAHSSNTRAHHVYRRYGFTDAPYLIMSKSVSHD